MFSIVLDVELMKALLSGVVLDADGTIAVVLNDGLVDMAAGHLDFGWKEMEMDYLLTVEMLWLVMSNKLISFRSFFMYTYNLWTFW